MEQWIYRNMEKYGNCLIPDNTIKRIGSKKVIELLENEFHRKVIIEHKVDCIKLNKTKRSKFKRYIASFGDWS